MRTRSLALTAAALLAGCSINYPQTAQEFREQIPGAFMGKVETFEVKRSQRDVSRTFQAKAPECLNVAVRTIERSSTSASNILTTYKPTVIVNDRRTELHVQRTFEGNIITPGKVPEGGLYSLVVDATPIDRNRTKIDIYGPSRGLDTMIRAVKGWATGENVGCPDLTQN